MRLVKVTATQPLRVRCLACGQWAPLATCLADLDGESFVAYYCPLCARGLTNGGSDERETETGSQPCQGR